jgi:eukaryotic-like serine/threonine-protein kinase
MALTAGSRFGSFEIVSLLGAGGMGEVYRARDTKLGREVALKILPDAFALDADRLARFKREAQVLASFNHPNIAGIYGLEDADGHHALVLELVEGPTLADRIALGPIPLDEALPIARQIAEALEAAHEQGVIHRDLKPANIKLREDGTVKVLDFGLAKLTETSPGASASTALLSQSPTITTPAMTGVGVILGTAAYMSPEQAKGRPIDKRSDIWALGCVWYELLTGKRAFAGDDVADTLAMVLRGEPDWSALPEGTPALIHTTLRCCLEKDRTRRISDASTVRFAIDESATGPQDPVTVSRSASQRGTTWRRVVPAVATAVVVAAFSGALVSKLKPSAQNPAVVVRFPLSIPDGQQITSLFYDVISISPDGTQIVYAANGRLYVRPLAEAESRPIAGTELGTRPALFPVFSPDGRWLAYASERTLKRIAVSGGTPATICQIDGNPAGISWDSDDDILFGQAGTGILRVAAKGGVPTVLARIEQDQFAAGAQMLPGGEHVLFTLATGSGVDRWERAQIVAQSLRSGERRILAQGAHARYVPTGHLVYVLSGVLYAAPFDVQQMKVAIPAVPVIEGVRRNGWFSGRAHFSISETGSLIYISGPTAPPAVQQELGFVDRKGVPDRFKLPPGAYQYPRIAPNGKRIVYGTDDGKEADVWVYEVDGHSSPRRLTFGGRNRLPIWSSDGHWVAFQSNRDGDEAIFRQDVDKGTIEQLTRPSKGASHSPQSWWPKGDSFLFSETRDSIVSLWIYSIAEKKAVPYGGIQSADQPAAVFSPDGRWVAYSQREPKQPIASSASMVFVQPFPATGEKFQIAAGQHPLWSPDGKELFIAGAISRTLLSVVDVRTAPSFAFGSPVTVPRGFAMLGSTIAAARTYDIAPDGQRFVGVIDPLQVQADAPAAPAPTTQIQVVLNWTEELKQRVAIK